MSRFFTPALAALTPYTPGEQPQNRQYIKLNTNESPYPPSPQVCRLLDEEKADDLRLYSDPSAAVLCSAIADYYGVQPANVFVGNGSDEVLAFAFQAFGKGRRMAFPDVTYAFYSVFAALFGIETRVVPLDANLAIDPADYFIPGEQVVLANPNALTGKALPLTEIERVLQAHPDDVVIIDEAYVDFGGVSAAALLDKYDNLLVVQTFSKSRSLAGVRVGLALGNAELIADLNTIKYSFNPYNVNRLSMKLAAAAMRDTEYFNICCAQIIADRDFTAAGLRQLGFDMTDSMANFLFVRHPQISGQNYYLRLKEQGILVRWFDEERIRDYVRITIGSHDDMAKLLAVTAGILQSD